MLSFSKGDEIMVEQNQEYQHIMVAVDGSDEASAALENAIETAKRNNGDLLIVHVIDNRSYTMGVASFDIEASEEETRTMKEILGEYRQFAINRGVKKVSTELVTGSPKELLAKSLPKEHNIDLILCGQSGLSGIESLMMGSVSQYIIREAPCDVLIVRNQAKEK